ncbi:amidohydrolase ytcJ-like [Fusarium beomiforme]|uniref:Amidohydrolase ytcJ-like n=1 Tax=Fusarium beomiforme TaxID=44412 RepID=A0A9P5APE4_9HYPO|nr:amidohydrolase ytcJ-like [Fusarium beomiforme]
MLFINGRILSKTETGLKGTAQFSDSMLIQDNKIVAVGSHDEVAKTLGSDVEVRDLNQRVLLPGFIDGHMHLLLLGQSLRKLDLSRCTSLDDIQFCIRQYAAENPDIPTILCKG